MEQKEKLTQQDIQVYFPPEQPIEESRQQEVLEDAQQALALVREEIPTIAPHESTVVVYDHSFQGAFYWGEAGGIHYISIGDRGSDNKYRSKTDPSQVENAVREERLYMISHELIHQGHAEKTGQAAFFGRNVGANIPDAILRAGDPEQIIAALRSNFPEQGRNFADAVEEAVAQGFERYLRVVRRRMLLSENSEEARARLAANEFVTSISCWNRNLMRRSSHPLEPAKVSQPHIIGEAVSTRLARAFGFRRLGKDFKRVNLVACRNITPGTSQWEDILSDPTKIPGLERLKKAA